MTTLTTSANRPAPREWSRELAEVLPGFLLILLMTGAVVWSLSVSNWAVGLEVLRPMALLGLVLGAIFARLPWLNPGLAHLLSGMLGFTWAIHLLGDLMDARLITWRDQATDLLIRGLIWARVIGAGGRGEDILLFVFVLCLLVWLLAYSTAWMVLRRGWTWRPILLNALVALINYTYVLPKPTMPFFVFLCAALLLLVYQNVIQRQALWDARQIEYPDLLPLRFLWSATFVCGLLIILTAFLPGEVSIDRATRTWTMLSSPFKAAREQWEDMFSTITAPPGAGSGAFTSRGAALGGSRQLTADAVMEVRSLEYDYWRAVAFDKYTGQGWQNTVGEQARAALGVGAPEQARTPREADEPLPVSPGQGRREVVQTFTMKSDRLDDLVMVGGTPYQISLPTLVEHNYALSGGVSVPNFDELALVVAQERLRAEQVYTVTALMSFADVASLRASGNDYPQWVRERYLALPETVTPRTYELAARLIAENGALTPYDQALVIQDYLRTIPYSESIATPPPDADLVDWFIFEERTGYCDYFASAMVVMLRSQGIPARWVRGYAGGEFDTERGLYVVRENVAHSWPEVYFPGFGWERFEPTAASYTVVPSRRLTANLGSDGSDAGGPLAPLTPDPGRFDELDEGLDQIPVPGILQTGETSGTFGNVWSLGPFGMILASLGLLALALYARWRYELHGLSQVGAAYAGMALLARWSGLGQAEQVTPAEYGALLAAALPEHQATIVQLARAYAREQYGGPAQATGQLFRGARVDLPSDEARKALHRALVRRIFTALPDRMSQFQRS